jgi:hypothetical protein
MPEPIVVALALALLYSLVLVEAVLVVGMRSHKPKRVAWWPAWFERLARNKTRAALAVAGFALIGRAVLLPILPIRAPQITDEFSYLLSADTFAHGRLTNPPHPMWQHFETIHVLQQPTYSSMYQPMQGLVLAAGKVLFGHPWFGVYLNMVLLCGLFFWALGGWLPPRWALFGAGLFALRIGLLSYWMNSYWGGAPAAAGGALVLGALPRLIRRTSAYKGLLMGLGVGVLALSRPFEGMMLCLGVGVVLAGWARRNRPAAVLKIAAAAALPVVLAIAGMGYYFYRVTGSPTQIPEMVQRAQYGGAPFFFWQKPAPEPAYRHKAIHDFYAVWEKEVFVDQPLLWNTFLKAAGVWLFYVGPLLSIPLIFAGRVFKDRRARPLVVIGCVFAIAFLLGRPFYLHYTAPGALLIWALIIQSIRHLAVWRRSTRRGLWLAKAIPVVCVSVIAIRLALTPVQVLFPPDWPMTWYSTRPGNVNRARVLKQLTAEDGRHLVIVHYGPDHQAVMNEWVYNDADIDGSKVVWAREMEEAQNAELVRYFSGRKVWTVNADEVPARLTPR